MEKGSNKINKIIKQLKEKKFRNENAVFLVEGLRFVNEIPKDYSIIFYAFSESFCNTNDLSIYEKNDCYVFDDKTFRSLSDTNNPQGIMAVVEKNKYKIEDVIKNSKKNALYIIAENLNDPGNLGTIIRTADACQADGIFLSKGSVDLYNGKVLRSTMGSVFHIPIITETDIKECVDILHDNGVKIYAAHLKGEKMPYDINLTNPSAFLIGNEAGGLSNETAKMADELIKIPMPGKAESLNASVAASVLMYEAVRQGIFNKEI
ncbi:MAG: RNA methyltransferase [Clostridia bacterium]|jgi:TrmH family RNA methyltransferase|nr:RNA methyltransferase [Clostridia bacterium]MCI2015470.1 RNA methyltransferase [Clostridia bacterium]